MVTLLMSLMTNAQWMEILGIILTVLECLLVITRILKAFFPENSKVGKFLSAFLKGLYSASDEAKRIKEEKENEDNLKH